MIRRAVSLLLMVMFLYAPSSSAVALTVEERLNTLEQRIIQLERTLSLSNFDVPGLVEEASPAVVSIYVVDVDDVVQGMGTGFLVSSDGMIFTNAHVLAKATAVKVKLASGTVHDAEIQLVDGFLDFAILDIAGNNYVHLTLSKNPALVGSPVLVIGNAYGYSNSVTTGIVSGVDRRDPRHFYHYPSLQIDAAINYGNSGGPILNSNGEVVAMASWTEQKGKTDGIAFGIPATQIMATLGKLVSGKGIVRPWLGIAVQEPYWAQAGLSNSLGLLVSDVHPTSAGALAGLQRKDWILEVNSVKVNYLMDLRKELEKYKPGDRISIKIRRRDNSSPETWNYSTLTVLLDEYSAVKPATVPIHYDVETDDLF